MALYSTRGVHGQTVETIARRIIGGHVAPGETLDVGALKEELGVSLTVLREALKVLSAKGLVDARQKRGTFVRPRADWNLLDSDVMHWLSPVVTDKFLTDLGEVREAVDPACARLAAGRRTDGDLDVLDTFLAGMDGAGADADRYIEADLGFHRALFTATHNELMERLGLIISAGLAKRDRFVHSKQPPDRVPAHRAVLEAVREADPDAAERAMRQLLDHARQDAEDARRAE